MGDDLGRLSQGAAAADGDPGRGVSTPLERLSESLCPLLLRYAVVVREAEDCAPCVLDAGVPRRRRATAGSPKQARGTMKRDDVTHFFRCERAVIDDDHLQRVGDGLS